MSGFVAFCSEAHDPGAVAALRQMSGRIAHRGDVESTWSFSDASGGAGRHRACAGFHVESHVGSRHAIVLDGLLTNLPELRRSAGANQGAGAAEIVLTGYERHGDAWFEKLDGSFAIFLCDLCSGAARLVRDRFGHRPLYFTTARGTVWAASEIKSLLAAPGVAPSLNHAALPAAIGYGVTPGPETLFAGVFKCLPGFVSHVGPRNAPVVHAWYRPAVPTTFSGTLEEAQEFVRSALRESVTRYVRECPQVGVLLSGGVDSALLAGQLAAVSDGRAHAVSFGASDWDQEESTDAQAVAHTLGMPFARRLVRPDEDILGALREVVGQLEEPTRFENAVALALTYPVAARACTALLTGEGGDSTLGEYEHLKARRVVQMTRLPRPVRSLLAAVPERYLRGRRLKALAGYCRLDSVEAFVQTTLENCPDLVAGPLHPPPLALQGQVAERISGWPPAAQYIGIDLLEFKHCWIERMEKLASLHGLECFHPFQTNALLDFGLTLPERLRIRGDHAKPILRELARARFGSELAFRRKRQLAAPMSLWLDRSQPLRAAVLRLKDPRSRIRAYLDEAAVDRHLAAYEQHGASTSVTSRTVFRMLGFELWLERFG